MSNAYTLMEKARDTELQAERTYAEKTRKLKESLELAKLEAQTFVKAAQAICGHEYVRTERWTEDGAYPNEPRSRVDCTICGMENVYD